jgi:hypothetical protein
VTLLNNIKCTCADRNDEDWNGHHERPCFFATHPHINGHGKFQSDKYPTCPPGKVPLSVEDPTAQDLLWEYAQRRRAVDAEFAADLELALQAANYVRPQPARGYRCKHAVEAMRWTDTDADREAFSEWFEKHGVMFETRGPIALLPDLQTRRDPDDGSMSVDTYDVKPGEWILFSDDEFIVMEHDLFTSDYEEISS